MGKDLGITEDVELTAEELEAQAKRIAAMEAKADADDISDVWENVQGSVTMETKLGVHQRIITAVLKDTEYRQLLLMAAFDDKREAQLAADAITERLRYGVDITPICDRVVAQCAVRGAHIDRVLNSMNSYTLQTNYGGKIPDWKKRQDNKSIG